MKVKKLLLSVFCVMSCLMFLPATLAEPKSGNPFKTEGGSPTVTVPDATM